MERTTLKQGNGLDWKINKLTEAIQDCDNPRQDVALIGLIGKERTTTETICLTIPSSLAAGVKALLLVELEKAEAELAAL